MSRFPPELENELRYIKSRLGGIQATTGTATGGGTGSFAPIGHDHDGYAALAGATFTGDVLFKSGRPWVDVRAFGAVGDNVADDTAAIQAAVSAAVDASVSYGTVASGSAPVVFFPHGRYKVSSSITITGGINYIRFLGNDAIIVAATDTFPVLDAVRYQVKVRGLSFRGGSVGVEIETGNVDTCQIDIEDCSFYYQATAAIRTVSPSNSTLLTIKGCKFLNNTTNAKMLELNTCDLCLFDDNWVTWGFGAQPIFYVADAVLRIGSGVGVPQSSSGPWIEMRGGGGVHVVGFRFGGEGGGRRIIDCYATLDTSYPVVPSSVAIDGCEVYVPSGDYIAKVFSLPNVLRLRGLAGNVDTRGVWFDPALTAADKANMGKVGIDIDANVQRIGFAHEASDRFAKGQAISRSERRGPTTYLRPSDVARNVVATSGGYGAAINWSGGTISTATDVFGRTMRHLVATADGARVDQAFSTFLSGLSAGNYTLVVRAEIAATASVYAQVAAGGAARVFDLSEGRHLLHLPFYFDPAAGIAQSTSASCVLDRLQNTDVVDIADFRLFRGNVRVDEAVTVVSAAAAPTTGDWLAADRVVHAVPAAAGNVGWVCTATGTPGTWTAFGLVFNKQAANPDTTGAALADLETEVNQLKAALRAAGVIAT